MAEFTMYLRDVVERIGDDIGLVEYPIFEESHREVLNKKILARYWMQEIGQESIELFVFFLNRRMNEVMPYFNQLYESEKLTFNPLTTTKMESTSTSTGENESTAKAESTNAVENKSRSVNSETPQTVLMDNGDYATAIADLIGTSDNTGDSSTESLDKSTGEQHNVIEGYQGTPSQLLNEYRATFLNIDLMVLESLTDLFMLIWSTDQPNF